MCIGTIPKHNRSGCALPIQNQRPPQWFDVGLPSNSCYTNDSFFVVITEVDTMNTVHSVSLNVSLEYLENLDTADFPFPNTIWHVKDSQEIATKVGVFAPIILGGIILNVIILLTILKNKWLWTPSNYLVANLAIMDLLTLLLCPTMLLIHDFYQHYVLGHVGCRVEGFIQGTMLLGGVGAVMLVSYDRLAAAVLTSEARVTKKFAPKLIAITYFIAAAICLPLALFREYREREWMDYLETYCVENINILPQYWHVLIVALVWLPLGVMMFTYGIILWRLEKSVQELCTRGGGVCVVRARSSAMWIAACVLLTTTLCRLPFTVIVYWRNQLLNDAQINSVEGSFNTIWFLAHYLIYVNCAINPLIYGFSNERFRRAMDKTRGISWCKFGSWCCICRLCSRKKTEPEKSEKVIMIDYTSKPSKKLSQIVKNILHLNQEGHDLPNADQGSPKATKITIMKPENI